MAKTKKQEVAVPVTRAEKTNAAKNLIKEILKKKTYKHNDLIDAAAKSYAEKFSGEDTENVNDVKGRVGSVLDIMKKEGEVAFEGGMYALKQENKSVEKAEKTVEPAKNTKTTRAKVKKEELENAKVKTAESTEKKTAKKTLKKKDASVVETEVKMEVKTEEKAKETAPKKKAVKKTAKKEVDVNAETPEKKEKEEYVPIPPAPLQPIAPVVPITPEVAPEPIPEDKPEEKPTPKKRAQKAVKTKKTEKPEKVVEAAEVKEEKKEEKPTVAPVEPILPLSEEKKAGKDEKVQPAPEVKNEDSKQLIVKEKAEIVKKDVVDMSFLFGGIKGKPQSHSQPQSQSHSQPQSQQAKELTEKAEIKEKEPIKATAKEVQKAEVKPEQKTVAKEGVKPVEKAAEKQAEGRANVRKLPQNDGRKLLRKAPQKPLTAEEKLRESFLRRLRQLGGEYFEYYSVYLLERYSMKNGRRLEGMRISGGGHDGGIDGEIELTDRFGFKETIYIQSKNWDPDKGDEKLWVVGETLLQQFIGACVCRQAKDGRQNARGIFVTTSRFTPDAKRILNDMSDKIIGYDGEDVYEAAKECQFGLVYENGNWKLDEKLLSGEKAFFNML